MTTIKRTKPIGRLSRLLLGLLLLGGAAPFLWRGSFSLVLESLGVVAGLLVFYVLVHLLIARYFPEINPWMGAVIANLPAGLVFVLGPPGGWIFGQGEGFLGAAVYVGSSLLIASLQADPGCEVMSLPALIFGKHTNLACLLFSPIDDLERRVREE